MGKPNNLKVFGSNKTTGPKQDSQNLAMVTYAYGRRTLVLLIITEPSGVFAHLRVQWLISQLTNILLN
jgi:hypothetical protein